MVTKDKIMARKQRTETVQSHLGLWDTVSLIVGIVIGAGIYETAPLIFRNVGGPWMAVGVWAMGGLLSLIGALCYAELASTYPRSGGDYVYLTKAYGPWAGFLFGWAQLSVIMTGGIGMMAYVFATYAAALWGFGSDHGFLYATGAVILLTLTNVFGVAFGRRAQNVLSGLKLLGLGGIILAGFLWGKSDGLPFQPAPVTEGSLGLAMILVLYTYGGWNDAALVTAEVANTRRNIPRALVLGALSVTAIYLLVNGAYLIGLGFDGARQSRAIAADVVGLPLGSFGAKTISILIMISALGAVNGLIYTGSRIYSTVGEDFLFFCRLARRNSRYGTPVWSLVIQAAVTIFMIMLVGTRQGRILINGALEQVGFGKVSWEGHGGFDTLLRCTAPVFWLFFLLSGVSLFVLRFKDKHIERPFKVPFYPLLPLIFCSMCLYMLYSATEYAGRLALLGAIPLLAGLFVYCFIRGTRSNAR